MEMQKAQRLVTQMILAAAALFFILDVTVDVSHHVTSHKAYDVNELLHTLMECFAVLALLLATYQMHRDRHTLVSTLDTQTKRLSSVLSDVEQRLNALASDRQLTTSEKDVMLLCLKGLSVEDIASARNVVSSTVKVQLSSIYKKFGVKSRSELLAILLDEYKELNA